MGTIVGNINAVGRKRRLVFSAEYQAIYDAFTIKPSASVAAAQNDLVESLVDTGVWAKLDTFYVFAGHTNANGESLINWFNPGTFDATAINAPAFVALEGFTGDGAASYINSNYNAATQGIKYLQDSASGGFYSRSNIAETKTDFGALSGNNRMYINSREVADVARYVANDNVAVPAANTNSRGMFVSTRTASNARALYKNINLLQSGAVISAGVPNSAFQFLALTALGAYSTKQLSLGFLGGGLVQADITNLYNAFQAYMTSNGKQV